MQSCIYGPSFKNFNLVSILASSYSKWDWFREAFQLLPRTMWVMLRGKSKDVKTEGNIIFSLVKYFLQCWWGNVFHRPLSLQCMELFVQSKAYRKAIQWISNSGLIYLFHCFICNTNLIMLLLSLLSSLITLFTWIKKPKNSKCFPSI